MNRLCLFTQHARPTRPVGFLRPRPWALFRFRAGPWTPALGIALHLVIDRITRALRSAARIRLFVLVHGVLLPAGNVAPAVRFGAAA